MAIVLSSTQYADLAIRGKGEVSSSDEEVFAVFREGGKVRIVALSEGVAMLKYKVGRKYRYAAVEVNSCPGYGIEEMELREQE
jgi:hypothetical protein